MTRRIPRIRLRGLAFAVVAAAGISALPLTAASATTYSPVLTCGASPASVPSGGSTTVSGTLTLDGTTPMSGDTVDLDYYNGSTFGEYASGTTDSSGHVSWTVHPTGSASWSCYLAGFTTTTIHGTDTYNSASSSVFSITVTPAVAVAPTHMSSGATPSSITAGAGTSITMTLLAGTTPVVGRTVYLNYYRPDSGGWQHLCSRTTDSTGSANCPDSPPATTTYAWGFDGDSTYGSSVSGNFIVSVTSPAPTPTPTSTLTPTHLTVAAPAGPVSSGAATRVTGYLETSAGAPVVGRTVELLANGVHVGDAVSDGGGFLQFTAYPTATTQYEWQFGGDATYGASQSIPPVTVTVTAANPGIATLISHINRHTIARGQRVRISGTYSQPFDGGMVVLYRQTANGRTRVASTAMDSDGYYLFRLRPRTLGTIHYITEVVQGGQAADAPSLTLHVHRAQ
jgi:hypothetical protein